MTYAIIGGLLLLIGIVVVLLIRWYGRSQKSIGTMSQVVKDQDITLKVLEAQRDAAIQRTDPTRPDDVLSKL